MRKKYDDFESNKGELSIYGMCMSQNWPSLCCSRVNSFLNRFKFILSFNFFFFLLVSFVVSLLLFLAFSFFLFCLFHLRKDAAIRVVSIVKKKKKRGCKKRKWKREWRKGKSLQRNRWNNPGPFSFAGANVNERISCIVQQLKHNFEAYVFWRIARQIATKVWIMGDWVPDLFRYSTDSSWSI